MTEQHTERELYNATDGPLPIDRAGRMLEARGRMPVGDLDLEASPLSGHIAAERMALVAARQPGADEDGFGGDAPEPEQPADDQPTTTRTRKGRASTSTQEG